jgi:hypothetical protein
MHRSGTSALARVVNLLGVPLCVESDLMTGSGNPTGHWESESLGRLDEDLLHMVGAAWNAPPPSEDDLLWQGALLGEVSRARQAFRSVHTTTQCVWKDPRLCILLPFWRFALPDRHVAVVVTRPPSEVAASLWERDRQRPEHTVAVWERYLRCAIVNCEGLPTMFLDYAELIAEPERLCEELGTFLRGNGIQVDGPTGEAAEFLRSDLRHHERAPDVQLPDSLHRLLDLIRDLRGVHARFPTVPLTPESSGIAPLLEPLRRTWGWVDAESAGPATATGRRQRYS